MVVVGSEKLAVVVGEAGSYRIGTFESDTSVGCDDVFGMTVAVAPMWVVFTVTVQVYTSVQIVLNEKGLSHLLSDITIDCRLGSITVFSNHVFESLGYDFERFRARKLCWYRADVCVFVSIGDIAETVKKIEVCSGT